MEESIKNILSGNAPVAGMLFLGVLWLRSKFTELGKKIDELSENKVWAGECEKSHAEVNRRLGRLERVRNGN